MSLRPKTVCLQGDPGSGKTMMVVRTAVRRPVYVMDLDGKALSADWIAPLVEKKDVIVWEAPGRIDETAIANRLHSLVTALDKQGPPVRPKGVTAWAEQVYRLPALAKETPIGTVLIDSATILNEHVKAMIAYDAKHTKLQFDEWAALKMWWMTTFSTVRDICREINADLIWTVHERIKGEPGERTTGMETTTDIKGNQSTTLKGTQDLAMWASIDGAFGGLIGVQCDEYYHLDVNAKDKEHPKWECRVRPDGRRPLRTTFAVDKSVFSPPDFREIWK